MAHSHTHLVNKGLVEEVRPTYAQVEHINALENGIVEGIEEP